MSESTTLTITPAGVIVHVDPDGRAYPTYVELDCETGELAADWTTEMGNAVPVAVWHQRAQRWSIPPLTTASADALLAELAPLAGRVLAGYACEWDGNNHVGSYTDEANEANEAIEAICEAAADPYSGWQTVEIWDAADACERPVLTGRESDEELETMAESIETEADDCVIVGVLCWLKGLRDDIDTRQSLEDAYPGMTSEDAIDAAIAAGRVVGKYADPLEDARSGLTASDAMDVAMEDPSLLWVD